MRKVEIATRVAVVCSTAFAAAGVAMGHEWRLLLVPLALLPILRMMGVCTEYDGSSKFSRARSVIMGITHGLVATTAAGMLSMHFSGGGCSWAPGAMTSAVTAMAMLPFFSGTVRYPALRTGCMYAALAFSAGAPFLFGDGSDSLGLGGVFIVFIYAPIRIWRVAHDRRMEQTA